MTHETNLLQAAANAVEPLTNIVPGKNQPTDDQPMAEDSDETITHESLNNRAAAARLQQEQAATHEELQQK